MPSNLPPGVSDSMLPGNRVEDIAWENFHEKIDDDACDMCLDPEGAQKIWEIGKTEWAKTQV